MRQVPEFELMLAEDGIQIIKFWLSVSKEEQKKRLLAVKKNPLASWKLSGLDKKAQNLWDDYSRYKLKMLKKTNLPFNPWVILDSNYVPPARVESIKYVLSQVPYPKSDATKKLLVTDSTIISIQK